MQIKSLHDYARDLRLGSVALRYHAVRQLVYYMGQGDLCGAILPAADDPDPILRREACLALGGFGREALAILLKALNDPDSQVAAAAARGLGQTGQTDAVPALFQALQSSGTDIRAAVGQALGAFPGAGAEKQLLDRLQAPGSIGEVIGMCSGLVELRSSEVVMPLTAVYMFATDQWVRDETWRFLTTLLGVEADTDELHEEVILEVIRQCLECVPHQLSDIDLTDIRKTVQERDIAGYCRLLFALAINLATAIQIDRGEWEANPFTRPDYNPDELRRMLPLQMWTSIAVLNGLGGIGRDVDGRKVEASLADYWLGTLCLVGILQEMDRDPHEDNVHPLAHLCDKLALSGRVEPRALIAELSSFGNDAVPLLDAFITEYRSGGPVWWAAKILGGIGTPEAVKVLIRCLDAEDITLSETACRALGTLGAAAIGQLSEYMKLHIKERAHGRETAAQALSMVRHTEALAPLFERAESPNSWVRFAAVRHLANFGDPAVIPVLQRLYADDDQDVSFAAAEALLEMAEIHSLDLPELLEIKRMYYDDESVQAGS